MLEGIHEGNVCCAYSAAASDALAHSASVARQRTHVAALASPRVLLFRRITTAAQMGLFNRRDKLSVEVR